MAAEFAGAELAGTHAAEFVCGSLGQTQELIILDELPCVGLIVYSIADYSSPAIDGGNNALCTNADQRGYPRPMARDIGGTPVCDIGAYEIRILPPSAAVSSSAILARSP